MSEVNGQPVLTNSKQVLTYESATDFYYSLSISAISDLNVWVNRCEGRFNVNGTTLAQLVKLPDSNIKFSQQLNLISITDNEIQLIANSETFIDGESHRNTTGLMERKVRVTHDYSDDIIGTWEGRLTSEQRQSVASLGIQDRWHLSLLSSERKGRMGSRCEHNG